VTITVEKEADWTAISKIGGPVVDPMILRCGELFLRGAKAAQDPNAAWDLMTRNIHALGTFFDHIILDAQIPVFNYGATYEPGQNFDLRTLSRVNEQEEILVDVDVSYGAYQQAKAAALAELKKLYDGRVPGVDFQQAQSILGELTTSGYAWYPNLGDLDLPSEDERRLAAYILGGLIFGYYAQLAGTDHLMQPKRTRLFLALSLNKDTRRSAEDYLFANLGTLTGRPVADIPYTPTFFPLLLAQSAGPAEMLNNALLLRHSPEVADYRVWLYEALADFKINGQIPSFRVREVEKIAAGIRDKLAGLPFPKVEIKTTVADVAALKPPGIGVDLTEPAKAAWGWLIGDRPGTRHRKLLTRAIIADVEYVALDIRVDTVWNGPGLPA